MKRNFENFVDSYVEYADNKFAPRSFHVWSAISLVAAALERKVWLPLNHAKNLYPNIYVFLVSLPGAGKSSALDRAVDFIRDYNKVTNDPIKIIPNQITEQKLIDVMSAQKQFNITPTKFVFHSSAFYPASEASNCLKVLQGGGDIVPALTDFYDCPAAWTKATKKDDETSLTNICFNLIAGCTYDYLGKLITGDSIFGGFASRVIYVVHGGKLIRTVKWRDGETDDMKSHYEFRAKLLQDFAQIAALQGPMCADDSFASAYEAWYPKFEEERQAHASEKMQSLLVRKSVNVLKVAALLCVAESSEMCLSVRHWERALALVSEVEGTLPGMLREAKSGQTTSQEGLVQAIMRAFETEGPMPRTDLQGKLTLRGFDAKKVELTVASLVSNNSIGIEMRGGAQILRLLVNPNSHL